MTRLFAKKYLFLFLALLVVPVSHAWAGVIPCPPNCNQPSSSTQNRNNQIISQIYALLAQQSDINNQISQYPRGAPPELIAQAQNIQAQITALSNQVSGAGVSPQEAQINALLNQAQAPGATLQNYQQIMSQVNALSQQSGYGGSSSALEAQANSLVAQLQTISNQISSYPNGAPPQLLAQAASIQNQINNLSPVVDGITGYEPLINQISSLKNQLADIRSQIAVERKNPTYTEVGGGGDGGGGGYSVDLRLSDLQSQERNLRSQISSVQSQLNADKALSASNPVANQISVLLAQQDAVDEQIAQFAGPGQVPTALTSQSLAIQQQIQALATQVH